MAIAVFGLVVGAVVLAAGDTLGFDFLAYHQAAGPVLAGERLYDPSVHETGGFGLLYYPPPFVLPLLPLALLDGSAATILWLGMTLAAFFAAVALMPVSHGVRWAIVLLAGLMWPVACRSSEARAPAARPRPGPRCRVLSMDLPGEDHGRNAPPGEDGQSLREQSQGHEQPQHTGGG